MIGVPTFCHSCGEPLRSCSLPAYCFNCDLVYQHLRRAAEGVEPDVVIESPLPPSKETSSDLEHY
jgi:hypothetical protein